MWKLTFVKRCLFLSCLIFLSFMSGAEPGRPIILFYNPEANINNFTLLKEEFDSYLNHREPAVHAVFQPFKNRSTFESAIRRESSAVIISSSRHFRELRRGLSLTPFLVGLWDGKVSQKRLMCAARDGVSLDRLTGRKLATSASADFTRLVLGELLTGKYTAIVKTVSIIRVPKDMDALLAINFGVVDVAVVTEATLNSLSKISPADFESMEVLASTEGDLLPIVATLGNPTEATRAVIDRLAVMGDTHSGRDTLKLIGLDGFKRLSPSAIEILEQKESISNGDEAK